MAHFANLGEVERISDEKLCEILNEAIGEKIKAEIIVNGCIIFVFVTKDGGLEAYLGCHMPFNNLKSFENIQIAAEFAKKIWGRKLADIRE